MIDHGRDRGYLAGHDINPEFCISCGVLSPVMTAYPISNYIDADNASVPKSTYPSSAGSLPSKRQNRASCVVSPSWPLAAY